MGSKAMGCQPAMKLQWVEEEREKEGRGGQVRPATAEPGRPSREGTAGGDVLLPLPVPTS